MSFGCTQRWMFCKNVAKACLAKHRQTSKWFSFHYLTHTTSVYLDKFELKSPLIHLKLKTYNLFFVIKWRPIGQCFGLWKLVACWWQVYNCRPAAPSPLCPCGSFYPIKLKLTSTCFPTRSNIYWICLLKTPSTTIGNVMICVIFNSQQTLAMYR